MKKITIYAIHSSKLNYKEEFYKPLLLSKCEKHNLILPLTEKYKNMYAKDLVKESDLIIIDLTNSTLSVFIETMWAKKMDKKILFLIKEKGKCFFLLNKYKKISKTYSNFEEAIKNINDFIDSNIEEVNNKDDSGTINLGSLT